MLRTTPITPKEMREINRTAILEYIRQRQVVSRSAVAEDLGLSLSSVVRIIEELMEEQLIRWSGDYESSGGRRRPLIEIEAEKNVTICVDIGGKKASAALCDITGNILTSKEIHGHGCSGGDAATLVEALIDEMLSRVGGRHLRGIGIGVPGIVTADDVVNSAPSLQWNNLPLGERLRRRYNAPIVIENDVNLEAMGELWFGHAKDHFNLLFLHIGTGLGLGIIQDGCLLRGSNNAAGEVGYSLMERADLHTSFPAPEFGALESAIAGHGLTTRMRHALLDQCSKEERNALHTADLFRYAGQGKSWAVEIVDDFVDSLSMLLINLSTAFDPDLVVIGGGITRSIGPYLDQISRRITLKTPNPVPLYESKLNDHAVILGGCASAFQRSMNYCTIRSSV